MTSLDSILKSRDITLPTKVPLVKAMVFPVVMYGCESEQAPGVGTKQGSLACCSPWSHKELDMTERLNCAEVDLLALISSSCDFNKENIRSTHITYHA